MNNYVDKFSLMDTYIHPLFKLAHFDSLKIMTKYIYKLKKQNDKVQDYQQCFIVTSK